MQWKGSWITHTEDTAYTVAPYSRKAFVTHQPVTSARLYICGVGYYIATVNGKPVGDGILDQAFTRYDKRLLYSRYDVTSLIKKDQNCIGVELGNGWYNLQTPTIWGFFKMPWRKSPRLLINLILNYKDGTCDTVVTDNRWKWHDGASQFNSLITGELYDARKEIKGWQLPGFNDDGWNGVLTTGSPAGRLEEQTMPAVRIIKHISPSGVRKTSGGRWLFDMGENFAGVVRLSVKGRAGDTVFIRYGEKLVFSGDLDRMHNAGHLLTPDKMPGFQTDIYILKGTGRENYIPRFTYHGFQYVEIDAPPHIQFNRQSVQGLFYSTGFDTAGTFSSSDTMLNKLYAASIQSWRSNFISIPTDCPQREKMGWLADGHIAAETGLWNFNAIEGYRKWLSDIRDVQLADGTLPGIAPTANVGYRWIDPEDPDFGPGWGSALPLIAWYVYLYTGDTAIVKENFNAVRKYVDMLARKAKATDYLYTTGLADFLATEPTPKTITSTALFYSDLLISAKMADVIAESGAANAYYLLADSVKTAFNKKFFDSATQAYNVRTVTALSAVLYNGLCPKASEATVSASLAALIKEKQFIADFGVMGTKWVLSSLSDHGYVDEAYRLLTNTSGGWGKWIKEGSTTLREGWDQKDESYNHIFFGEFNAWFYKSLAGIRPVGNAPGFRHFIISPAFPKEVKHLQVRHETGFGEIKVSWKRRRPDIIDLVVVVPRGASCDIKLPGLERHLSGGAEYELEVTVH